MRVIDAKAEHINQVFGSLSPASAAEIESAGYSIPAAAEMMQERVSNGAETWAVADDDMACMVGFPRMAGVGVNINTVAAQSFKDKARPATVALARKMRDLQKRWPDTSIYCVCHNVTSGIFEWYGALGFEFLASNAEHTVFRRPSLEEAR